MQKNYYEVQSIWKNIRTDEGKKRKSFIRLKLFVYCVKGNDKDMMDKINGTAKTVQHFLKSLSKEDWCLMLKYANIKILIDYWLVNGLISKMDFRYFK